MPFKSLRQQRAAFGGHIPGFSKERAKEWADETDFKRLPDRAPAEKRKPTLKHSSLHEILSEHRAALVEEFSKISFAVPAPGQASMTAKHVGSFAGQATTNFLKAPGSTTVGVTNPRLSLRNAMTKNMRT